MKLQFQLTPIQPGNFYISDTGEAKRGPPTPEDKPSFGRNGSRVAGPFNTREDAESERQLLIKANPNLKGNRLYVWYAAIQIPIGKFQDLVGGKIPDYNGHKLDDVRKKAKTKGHVIVTAPGCPDQVPTFDDEGKYKLEPVGPVRP